MSHKEDWFLSELGKGGWQAWEIEILVKHARLRKPLLDIGAHVGVLSMLYAKHGAKVIAVEPDIYSLGVLSFNVLENDLEDSVRLIHGAISTETGIMAFGDKDSLGSSIAELDHGTSNSSREIQTFTCATLRAMIGFQWRGLIKIDIEGEEWRILPELETLTDYGLCPLLLSVHLTGKNSVEAVSAIKKSLSYYQFFQTEACDWKFVSNLDPDDLATGTILFANDKQLA